MNAQPQPSGPTDSRALLASIGRRMVRNVAAGDDQFAEALFAIVLERKRSWEHGEWEATVKELDESQQTVSEWLSAERARERS